MSMKEFFGFGGYTREAEGFLSWQHLLFVGSLLTAMVIIAIILGKHNRTKSNEEKKDRKNSYYLFYSKQY